jgi:hypothetical protein
MIQRGIVIPEYKEVTESLESPSEEPISQAPVPREGEGAKEEEGAKEKD